MDPDKLDAFILLKAELTFRLIASFSGVSWALQVIAILSTIGSLHTCFEALQELAIYAIWEVHILRLFDSTAVLWPKLSVLGNEAQYARNVSRQRQCLQNWIYDISFLATISLLGVGAAWLDTPLLYFIRDPWWFIWLGYRGLVCFVIPLLMLSFTLDYPGASLTPSLATFLIYPLQIVIKRRRQQLSASYLAPLKKDQVLVKYQYQPVTNSKQFRILKLTPASGHIAATLEEATPDSCPPYWAVSYVWGPPERTHSLAVLAADGTKSYLRITQSCANVLSLLTPLNKPRYLWIDAICINQDNPSDKVSQIPLMASIYSGAAQVIGCLFSPEIWFFSYLNQRFIIEMLRFPRATPSSPKTMIPIHTKFHDWSAFFSMCMNAYWRRVWIVQEMCLAKKLVFIVNDPYTFFTWDQFYAATKNLYALISLDKITNVQSFANVHANFFLVITYIAERLDMLASMKADIIKSDDPASRPPLAEVLDRIYPADSTNPRDQIFALLSLASDGQAPELQPTYNEQATSHREVLCKTFLYFLEQGHIQFLLSGYGSAFKVVGVRPVPGLPSWVPVLPKPHRHNRFGSPASRRARVRRCHLTYRVSDDLRVLSVRGVVADEVAVVIKNPVAMDPSIFNDGGGTASDKHGEIFNAMGRRSNMHLPENHSTLWSQIWAYLFRVVAAVAQHYDDVNENHFANAAPEALAMRFLSGLLMCESRQDISELCPGMDAVYDNLTAFVRDFVDGDPGQLAQNLTRLTSSVQEVFKGAVSALAPGGQVMQLLDRDGQSTPLTHFFCYHFAITKAGRMAWVLPGAEAGDKVCLLDQLEDVPLLLRPLTEQDGDVRREDGGDKECEDQFMLVSDAWVQLLSRDQEQESQWLKLV